MRRRTLVTMSPLALRVQALEWFIRGFSSSGMGFTGEQLRSPAIRRMLTTEFNRLWDAEVL